MLRLLLPHGRAGLLAIVAILGTSHRSDAQEKKATPAEAIVGTWRADISDEQAVVLEVRGSAVAMKLEAGGAVTPLWAGKVVFPAENADRHFDWVELTSGGRAMPDNRCLYQLSGGTLLVIGGGPTERPTRFLSGPGPGSRTLIFRRMVE